METIMDVLNEYYGDSRSKDHKNEVADFIETMWDDLKHVMEDRPF